MFGGSLKGIQIAETELHVEIEVDEGALQEAVKAEQQLSLTLQQLNVQLDGEPPEVELDRKRAAAKIEKANSEVVRLVAQCEVHT